MTKEFERKFKDEMSENSTSTSFRDDAVMHAVLGDSLSGDSQEIKADNMDDEPEELVRNENKAVNIVRVVVLVVLVCSALATGWFVFFFTRDSENSSWKSEFGGVANRLVSSMTSDTALKFWVARTLSSAVTMAMQASNANQKNLTIPLGLWDHLTQEARFNANIVFAGWSPLLFNDQDREEFEAFASKQTFSTGANPVCYLCGEERKGFLNPEQSVEIPGFGVYPCGGVDEAGRMGVLPEENCLAISQGITQTCKCGDLPADATVVSNQVYIPDKIFKVTEDGDSVPEITGLAPYQPIWQTAVLNTKKLPIMYNEMSDPVRKQAVLQMMAGVVPVMSETYFREGNFYDEYGTNFYAGDPGAFMYYPIFGVDSTIVGSVTMEILWATFLSAIFPTNSDLVDLVIESSCGSNKTFQVDMSSETLVFVGDGCIHESAYVDMVRSSTFEEYEELVRLAAPVDSNQTELNYCRYRYHVFATSRFEQRYVSKDPYLYASIAGAIFLFTSAVFILYDIIVRRRQSKVMGAAKRTNTIVAELFPREVRGRLFERAEEKGLLAQPTESQMEDFLCDDLPLELIASEPIADFFPHTTIMFLDVVGFTAWSSEREPVQVFKLLETIYQSFDEAAKKYGVFKVETIGDSYVAVCGLPVARENHALVMVQFARECLKRMLKLTQALEKFLGPSTADLRARVGLHSGPVTAGVLRGEKARFQLFGDAVNTASRLESTGMPHCIHASPQTVELLVATGKRHWAEARQDLVHIKGKGELQTYWINPGRFNEVSSHASLEESKNFEEPQVRLSSGSPMDGKSMQEKRMRLVDWNVEMLYSLLERVVSNRSEESKGPQTRSLSRSEKELKREDAIVIDEMTHILALPMFNGNNNRSRNSKPEISPQVKEQLRQFVTAISNLYRDVPFHNFEHASHVIMSAGKLMKRIVNPDGVNFDTATPKEAAKIHEKTYGLCSDKLMQFAVVFSALIHDVDHTGLSNAELIKMGAPVSIAYKKKSVAEQNSVDVAWAVLMNDRFKDLRSCIYTNENQLKRFRQLVVNAVMATDIADKELKSLREKRWDDAFSARASESAPQLDSDRKATIVFEYILQASDVAHTMQHWHTYQKFNKRLFMERYLAWKNGHAGEKDPSHGWHAGELWFFDNYIIPLAQKLKTCGVFGVSHDEYLNYAEENRKEWKAKGPGIVAEMLEFCRAKYDSSE